MGCQPGDFAYDHFNLPLGFVHILLKRIRRVHLAGKNEPAVIYVHYNVEKLIVLRAHEHIIDH